MLYKPVQGLIKVGREYSFLMKGPIYCAEHQSMELSVNSMDDFSQALRLLNIDPYQINNTGTEKPFRTDRLNDRLMEELTHHLFRPIIRVLKKYNPKLSNENLNYPYLIEIGNSSSITCTLEQVSELLKGFKCKESDILLHEEVEEGFDSLNNLHSLYIKDLVFR